MRLLLTWLMVFCVLAGLNARVLAGDAGHATACSQSAEPCCQDHHDAPAPEEHEDGGKSCPLDHHHHGCCSHALPLTVESDAICPLGLPGSSLLGVRHEGEVPPDGPFLSSEKPPLI